MSYMSEWKRLLLFLYHSELYQLSILIFLSLQAIHCLARTISDGKKESRRKSKIENCEEENDFFVLFIWFDLISQSSNPSHCAHPLLLFLIFYWKYFFYIWNSFTFLIPHLRLMALLFWFLSTLLFLPLRAESNEKKKESFWFSYANSPRCLWSWGFHFESSSSCVCSS